MEPSALRGTLVYDLTGLCKTPIEDYFDFIKTLRFFFDNIDECIRKFKACFNVLFFNINDIDNGHPIKNNNFVLFGAFFVN